jgi:hypothetical protein
MCDLPWRDAQVRQRFDKTGRKNSLGNSITSQ